MISNRPMLYPWLLHVWSAFSTLSRQRDFLLGAKGIVFKRLKPESMVSVLAAFGFKTGRDMRWSIELLCRLDQAWMEFHSVEQSEES